MMAKAEELRNKDPAETIPKAMAPAGVRVRAMR